MLGCNKNFETEKITKKPVHSRNYIFIIILLKLLYLGRFDTKSNKIPNDRS